MSDDAADRPFYATRAARAPDETRHLYWALLAAMALAGGGLTWLVGFPKGGTIGADMVSQLVYLVGFASLPLVGISLALAGLTTFGLAWTPRRKDHRRGWFEDFAPLLLCAVIGGAIALAAAIGPSLRAAEAQVAVTTALDAHTRLVNDDTRKFNVELMEMIATNGPVLDPRRLARDTGYRQSPRLIAQTRALYARQRKLSEDRFAQSRLALANFAKGKAWRDEALAIWDRRIAQDLELTDNFYNGQEEIMDSAERLIRVLKGSPGFWEARGYVFNRKADFDAFEAGLKTHRALVTDVNAQAISLGMSNFESANRATAVVGH